MPYKTIADLPDSVKHVLPIHAQEIYAAAFNHAWEEYKNPQKRQGQESKEQIAHKVAWTAVEKKYTMSNGSWVER